MSGGETGTPKRAFYPGTIAEGLRFLESFCGLCRRDEGHRNGAAPGCEILVRALKHTPGESLYPGEWIYGDSGRPMCGAFVGYEKRCGMDRENVATEPVRAGDRKEERLRDLFYQLQKAQEEEDAAGVRLIQAKRNLQRCYAALLGRFMAFLG